MVRSLVVVAGVLGLAALAIVALAGTASVPSGTQSLARTAPDNLQMPVAFAENLGQAPDDVRYVGSAPGGTLLLEDGRVVLRTAVKVGELPASPGDELTGKPPLPELELREVVMSFVGARPVTPEASGPFDARLNYYKGDDPNGWTEGVRLFGTVTYDDLYPGVDLVFYGQDGALEYDLVLEPGVDPSIISLTFEGAEDVKLVDGALVLAVDGGEIRMRVPAVYQQSSQGQRTTVDGQYVLDSVGNASFDLGAHDRDMALVIDPVFEWATYLGADDVDWIDDIDIDPDGLIFVTGFTYTASLFDGSRGEKTNGDGFAAVFGPDGDFRGGSVYGGSETDGPYQVSAWRGQAVTVGATFSPDFPAPEDAFGGRDSYIMTFDSEGAATGFERLGGANQDWLITVQALFSEEGDLDRQDEVSDGYIVGGFSNSTDLPFVDPLQEPGGLYDAVLLRRSASNETVWFTPLGGPQDEFLNGVAYNPLTDQLVITGSTFSDEVLGLSAPAGGDSAAFLIDLRSDLSVADHLFGTGGFGTESAFRGLTFVPPGSANPALLVTGSTNSEDFTFHFSDGATESLTCPHSVIPQPGGGEGPEYDVVAVALRPGASPAVLGCHGTPGSDEHDGRGDAAGGEFTFATYETNPGYTHGYAYAGILPWTCVPGGQLRGPSTDSLLCPEGALAWLGTAPPALRTLLAIDFGHIYAVQAVGERAVESAVIAGLALDAQLPTTTDSYQQGFNGVFDGMLFSLSVEQDFLPDLYVTKAGGPNPVGAGGILEYTFAVGNTGLTTATNVVLDDPLPASFEVVDWSPDLDCAGSISCELGSLAPGEVKEVVVRVRPQEVGDFTNTVTVSADQDDEDPADNEADADITVTEAPAAVDVQVGGEGGRLVGDGRVLWRFFVWNNGPNDASDVSVTLVVDPAISDLTVTSSAGSVEGNVVSVGDLVAEAAHVTIHVEGRVSADESYTVTAQASEVSDINPANNLREANLDVIGLFEGYTPSPWFGLAVGAQADRGDAVAEVITALDLAIEPDVWQSVSYYDTAAEIWLSVYSDAPLPSFNTLQELVPGEGYWFFVTEEALMATSPEADDLPPGD